VRTFKQRLERLDMAALEATFRAIEAEGAAALAGEGFAAPMHRFERLVDLRYAGANSELTLPLGAQDTAVSLRERFAVLHEQQFGYRSDTEAVETMNLRVIARVTGTPSQVPDRLTVDDASASGHEPRSVYFGPRFGARPTRVCARADLGAAWTDGPLLVEEFDSTTVVPPDGRARRIAWDTIEIELAP
jgi:N-methylhydantoinase A